MELKEAEKIIKNSFLFKDANEHIQLKEAISTVLRELESAREFIEEEEETIVEKNNKICELEYKNIELQEENKKYRSGELLTANQVKSFEETTKKYYIHKDKIKEKIEEQVKRIDKLLDEMIDKSIGGINVSGLNKKEREQVIAKRNSLLVQKATLQQVKEELLKGE